MKMNKLSRSSINRRNVFGENLLYKAALHNDADLVHHCIKQGGNVNQPSYAGRLGLPSTVILRVVCDFITASVLWKYGKVGLRQVSNRKLPWSSPAWVPLHHHHPGQWEGAGGQGSGRREEHYISPSENMPAWGPVALHRRMGFLGLTCCLWVSIVTMRFNFEWKEVRSKAKRSWWYTEL